MTTGCCATTPSRRARATRCTDDLYASLSYTKYLADLFDGNTAFQAYNLHEMASGCTTRTRRAARPSTSWRAWSSALEAQYAFGTFKPDFGDGLRGAEADEQTAKDHNVAVGSKGFSNRYGGWNSLETRDFEHMPR